VIEQARARDQDNKGGALHGVLFGIKDIFDTSICRPNTARQSTKVIDLVYAALERPRQRPPAVPYSP